MADRGLGLSLLCALLGACSDGAEPAGPARAGAGAQASNTSGSPASHQGAVTGPGPDAGRGGTGGGGSAPDAAQAARDAGTAMRDASASTEPDRDAGRDAARADAAGASDAGMTADAAEPDPATYTTNYWAGGLNHLVILKEDMARSACVKLSLSSPSAARRPELEVPVGWSLEYVSAIPSANGCADFLQGGAPATAQELFTVRGRIAWHDPGPFPDLPCSIDVDVVVTFDPAYRLPGTHHLRATDLPVDCMQ